MHESHDTELYKACLHHTVPYLFTSLLEKQSLVYVLCCSSSLSVFPIEDDRFPLFLNVQRDSRNPSPFGDEGYSELFLFGEKTVHEC